MDYFQEYRLLGKTKPAVRANKRMTKDPKQREQYNQYIACRESYCGQAWVQRQEQEAFLIPKQRRITVLVRFFLHSQFLFNSDVDNMLKTVFDSLTGVAYEDDRYITVSGLWEFIVPAEMEPWVHVQVIDCS